MATDAYGTHVFVDRVVRDLELGLSRSGRYLRVRGNWNGDTVAIPYDLPGDAELFEWLLNVAEVLGVRASA